jgi:CheY-like chemotaxis protein
MATVLVVDDDRDCVEFLSIHLRGRGHVVHTASDGASALAALERFRHDLLLLDLRLPGMDSGRVVEILRGNALTEDLPVLFVSAADARWAASRLPVDPLTRYLEKPLDFARLDAVLAELLALKPAA